jgi:hypothetical protein
MEKRVQAKSWRRRVGWLAVAALAIVWSGPAAACNCPKEQMIKKYGTVSMLRHGPPLPPPLPPAKAGAPGIGG